MNCGGVKLLFKQGLQGSSRVQSHSFWEEAVPQSGGPALNALLPPVWVEGDKQCECGVKRGPFPAFGGVNVHGGGSAASHSALSSPHRPLQNFLLCCWAATMPNNNDNTLHVHPVFDVSHNQPLIALHDYLGEGYCQSGPSLHVLGIRIIVAVSTRPEMLLGPAGLHGLIL